MRTLTIIIWTICAVAVPFVYQEGVPPLLYAIAAGTVVLLATTRD